MGGICDVWADGFEVEMVAVKFLTHPMGGVPGSDHRRDPGRSKSRRAAEGEPRVSTILSYHPPPKYPAMFEAGLGNPR